MSNQLQMLSGFSKGTDTISVTSHTRSDGITITIGSNDCPNLTVLQSKLKEHGFTISTDDFKAGKIENGDIIEIKGKPVDPLQSKDAESQPEKDSWKVDAAEAAASTATGLGIGMAAGFSVVAVATAKGAAVGSSAGPWGTVAGGVIGAVIGFSLWVMGDD